LRYNHVLEGGNMCVLRGFSIFSFNWNSSNTKLPLGFNKNNAACRCVFVVAIWFYCKYHVGSEVIGYLYVYKLLFIFKTVDTCLTRANGWASPASYEWCYYLKMEPNAALRGDVRSASPPQAQWQCTCAEVANERALAGAFSLPPTLPSLLLENHAAYCKKTRRSGMVPRPKVAWVWYGYLT
jgi:hypothetical protein